MKLTAILLLTACLQVSAKTYSQTITLNVQNAPLDKVIKEIEKQTKVNFFYQEGLFQTAKPVTVSVSKSTLQQTLELCFSGQPFEYKIVQNTVFVKQKGNVTIVQTEASRTGNGIITGKVITKEGEPLVSANIINKRTGKGTSTDAKGNFSLNDVNLDDILIISYTGFSSHKIKVSGFISLTLILEPATNSLDKVVIQAYGQTTKRFATGNITTITSEEIEKQPVMNVLQALQGKIPGVEIIEKNGFSSSPYKVEIRGRKYLGDLAPDPLIIIDGVPINVLNFQPTTINGTKGFSQSGIQNPIGGQSPLFSIDPSEIESVTVLKDADATAIYGSRGGSGVVIITTKKGKIGVSRFNVTYSSGFQKNLYWYDLMNTQQYLEMRREAFKNDNRAPTISNAPDLLRWDTTSFTDWQRFIYGGTGRISKLNADLSGGDKTNQYRLAIGYETRKNITTFSGGNDRISITSNISHASINNLFKVELTNLYSYAKINTSDLPSAAILLPPNAPAVFDSVNKLNFSGWNLASALFTPFQSLLNSFSNNTSFLNCRLALIFMPFRGLELKSSIGYSKFDEESRFVIPIASQDPLLNPSGSVYDGNTKGNTWIFEPQATYKFIKSKFKSELLIGSSMQSSSQRSMVIEGTGYKDDNLLSSVSNAPIKYGTEGSGQYKYFALFGRANFSFKDRYITNFNIRRDGSSRFGPGKQYGNFWSIGGAWILSEEKWFLPFSKIISFFKLRSSYGVIGSDNINDYVYLTRWTGNRGTVNPYGGNPAYAPIQHANSELQWQQNKKLEVAGNVVFWGDRLNIDVSWYRDRCTDQLLATPLPLMTGFPTVSANLPATVQNSGFEIKLSGEVINTNIIRLSTNFNVGLNKNKLIDFPGLENSPYANQYTVGNSLNLKYLIKYTGIDPTTGQYSFEDKNKDGIINSNTSLNNTDAYVYNMTPKYFGGFGIDINYKKLSLSTFCTFSKIPYLPRAIFNASYGPGTFGISNQSVDAINRWMKPGDNAEFTRYTTKPQLSDFTFFSSDGFLSEGTYLKVQNISLSYFISKEIISKVKCQGANIYIRAQNLITFTNYDGLDPSSGSGLGSYPLPFTLTVGAALNF